MSVSKVSRWGQLFPFTALLLVPLAALHAAERIWWDGTRENDQPPPGKLLSDNDGWWGDCVLTGVEYRYESAPTAPADVYKNDSTKFGRRLLDGIPSYNWWVPVGQGGNKPLAVVFDFKRECVFGEVDVASQSKKVSVKVECRLREQDDWRPVFERSCDACPEAVFHRLTLTDQPRGRYLRLSIQAQGTTYLNEVVVWGKAEVSEKTPEAYQPVKPAKAIEGTAFASIPGIEKTAFSDREFMDWQGGLGTDARKAPAVWSLVPTWDSITDRPILPVADKLAREVAIVMARNETECAALALTSATMEKPVAVEVALSAFRRMDGNPSAGLRGQVRIGGAIASRHFGVNIGPLFEADNLLPGGLMQRYLVNASGIKGFPKLALSPGGSAILWLSVTSEGAAPGLYEAKLTCADVPPLPVRVEVVDVTLPQPRVWLNTWSGTTTMFPFVTTERSDREMAYKQSLGVTVWNGFPVPGSDAARARVAGRTFFHVWGIGDYGDKLYQSQIDPEKLTPVDEQKIGELIRAHVKQAADLGLGFDAWYVELTDEPGLKNAAAHGALCRLIRKADPRVRIYCNPCFWGGKDVAGDEDVFAALGPWYRENVDVSVPLMNLLRKDARPRSWPLFDAARFVRACYTVCSQSAKSERAAQIGGYRHFAWDAFERNWNGWGFYSYYAPRGNPWNDFDTDWRTGENMPDYQIIYPGPRGPIPTRQSEAVREGWEDYCLLTLLKERAGQEAVAALLKDRAGGKPVADLRLRALRAVVKKSANRTNP